MGSKQDKLEILMGKVYHKGEKQRNKYTDTKRSKFRKDIYFNRVVSIKSRGIKHTYCLTVEGRNFIANGIVSSNSISKYSQSFLSPVPLFTFLAFISKYLLDEKERFRQNR